MKLNIKKPIESLSKGYFRQGVDEKDIRKFEDNVRELLKSLNENESEEFNKKHIREFLSNTYYTPQHEINTRERNDLVIHHGADAKTDIGVIIETKKPGKIPDMVNQARPNVKALHELIAYYLKERHSNGQHRIKNLIATNGREWFIFDEVWFENNIYQKLKREYLDFQASGNKTDHFYRSIERYLDGLDIELPCTYINLTEAFAKKGPGKKELLALYKTFAPEHLLKKPFANDSNTLNKGFYYELLYILGLEEKKDGGKKLITRSDKNRRDGSLLEGTIHKLQSSGKWSHIDNLMTYGENEEQQIFSIALELCINWLNRILFLKLLEGQLKSYQRAAKASTDTVEFLNIERIAGFGDLNDLFFEVLAKPLDQRQVSTAKMFGNIPYLNSSLFELSELEDKTIEIADLSDRQAMPVYSDTILKDEKGKRKAKDIGTLQYLFEFLNAYDFSSDENDEVQRSGRQIINAAVLGLIFEKINGYKDGSFYTPGFITMYMSREVLHRAVVQKFNERYTWSCETLTDVYNEISRQKINIKDANEVVNSLKVCDPAVGSGHFLVSVLNEMIAIKYELGILADRNGKLLRHDVSIDRDELVVMDGLYDFYVYNYADAQSQRVQETLFHEKQTIIENCLFGVDINPKSVMICRLRLWIELLKNAYYVAPETPDSLINSQNGGGYTERQNGPQKGYGELQTLPNIDINIKCGNSLISRFALDEDLSEVFRKQKFTRQTYLAAVESYKNATSKKEKEELRSFINQIKENFKATVFKTNPIVAQLSNKRGELTALDHIDLWGKRKLDEDQVELAKRRLNKEIAKLEEQLVEYQTSAIYRNAFEWRFEFPEVLNDAGDYVGFDVVIGNPPYIYNRDLPELERTFYQEKYNVADDLYHYFLIDGLNISKRGGLITLITPNTYFTLSTKVEFREVLLHHSNLRFTYCGFVFEDAYVEAQIFSIKKEEASSLDSILFIQNPQDYKEYEELSESYSIYQANFLKRFFWPTEINKILNQKIAITDKDAITDYKNKLLGKKINEKRQLDGYRQSLKPSDITFLGLISDGEQGLVTGNNSKYVGCITETEDDSKEIDLRFLQLLNQYLNKSNEISYSTFLKDKEKYYELAETIKKSQNKPGIFGKFFNYKTIQKGKVKHYRDLSKNEKQIGGGNELWLYYNRGNSEGYKWIVPYVECIWWSKESVSELQEGVLTNSRWQGDSYFESGGFGWVDYFTDKIKAFWVRRLVLFGI
jgi:hypothetical protein